jgi:two-component system phosphate regulon response regulator PhoB
MELADLPPAGTSQAIARHGNGTQMTHDWYDLPVVEAPTILIVEDEIDLLRTLEYSFQAAGFVTVTAGRGRDAVPLALSRGASLVLLDVMLPDISGWDVCRKLKGDTRTQRIPIIMLTARAEEIDRIVGFELGVDDYVTKPFSPRELVLRARAVLRRGEPASEVLAFGPLKLDLVSHRVQVEGRDVELTALEFKLLETFMRRVDRVQTRELLLNDVWGLHLNVETRTVDTHVKRLREKLDAAGNLIHTVRGVGYRFGAAE